jgi:hypothetical protein
MPTTRMIMGAILLTTVPVTGLNAKCWTADAEDAARIRTMETMLMVGALRCRSSSRGFLTDYNKFVAQSRPALVRVNQTLRMHFAPSGGIDAYDRYVTSIANRYGAGVQGLDCRDMSSILKAASAERGSYAGLSRMARSTAVSPDLRGGRCPTKVAARR